MEDTSSAWRYDAPTSFLCCEGSLPDIRFIESEFEVEPTLTSVLDPESGSHNVQKKLKVTHSSSESLKISNININKCLKHESMEGCVECMSIPLSWYVQPYHHMYLVRLHFHSHLTHLITELNCSSVFPPSYVHVSNDGYSQPTAWFPTAWFDIESPYSISSLLLWPL